MNSEDYQCIVEGDMQKVITAYEASQKYKFSMGYIRLLMRSGKVKGRQALMNPKGTLWLIEEASLKKYLAQDRTPGRKPKKKPKNKI